MLNKEEIEEGKVIFLEVTVKAGLLTGEINVDVNYDEEILRNGKRLEELVQEFANKLGRCMV